MAGNIYGQSGPRVLAVTNQKGGVGKTTTAINLGTALAAIEQRVLIIDLDPQGNASTGLGIDERARQISTYDVLSRTASLIQAAMPSAIPNLYVVPATRDLAGLEPELNAAQNKAFRLRDSIMTLKVSDEQLPENERFDYVLIDCPPSLNILTLNAMSAADSVLVPVQCEFFALEGIKQLHESIEFVKGTLNPDLEIHGVVLTMHDARAKLSEEVVNEVKRFFGPKVYETLIPRNIRIAEAPSHGKPILLYDHKSIGSKAYIKLAREIIDRENLLGAA